MKKLTSVAASAAIIASVAAVNANATENPFGMKQLSEGYNVAMSEGTCGEGKCGGDKGKEAKCGEGKCGEKK